MARAVLRGETRGYTLHPQLERFLAHDSPRLAINAYLASVYDESLVRGYNFDRSKIGPVRVVPLISVNSGQIHHEWRHLLQKLETRSPSLHEHWLHVSRPKCHSLFIRQPGPMATWERASTGV